MPFKSEAQRKACWAQYNRDKKAGKTPSWDCKEWERDTPKNLPYKVSAQMPGGDILPAKQDLASFSRKDLQLIARHLNLPDTNSSDDLAWMIAITLHGQKRAEDSKPEKGTVEYLIHDNGGRELRVVIKDHTATIYRRLSDPETYEYTGEEKELMEFKFKKVFVGTGVTRFSYSQTATDKQCLDFSTGHTLLFHINNKKYIFVGMDIKEFTASEPITEFLTTIGNNDVPYTVMLTKNNFIIEDGNLRIGKRSDLDPEVLEEVDTVCPRGIDATEVWMDANKKSSKQLKFKLLTKRPMYE